ARSMYFSTSSRRRRTGRPPAPLVRTSRITSPPGATRSSSCSATSGTPARGQPYLVMLRHDGERPRGIDLPGEPAPHGPDRPAAFEFLSVAGVELLAVEYGHRHVLRPGKSLGFGNAVQGLALPCGVEEGRQGVRLPTSERR